LLDTLAKYDFTIEHIPGSKNTAADALSRIQLSALEVTPLLNDQEILQKIKEGLANDDYFGEFYAALQNSDDDAAIPKHIRQYIPHYKLIDNLLYFTPTVGSDNNIWRLCILNIQKIHTKLFKKLMNPQLVVTSALTRLTSLWPNTFIGHACSNTSRLSYAPVTIVNDVKPVVQAPTDY
jgi:hypothetical protein